jgi:hypothetical protein
MTKKKNESIKKSCNNKKSCSKQCSRKKANVKTVTQLVEPVIPQTIPEIEKSPQPVGIYGKICRLMKKVFGYG